MSKLKETKNKIITIRNIWRLTGSLETLSALKMKKAQQRALNSRPFAQKVAELLEEILENLKFPQKGEKILIVPIASDRGFCAAFNRNILRLTEEKIKNFPELEKIEIFPIGRKGMIYFKKKYYKIRNYFLGIGDFGELEEVKPISDFLFKVFKEGEFKEIYLVWTDFVSAFYQKPIFSKLLPLDINLLKKFLPEKKESNEKKLFKVEPSWQILTQEIVPQLIEYLLYQAILESNASEHSARMLAMKQASEAAKDKEKELILEYNKVRQEAITTELEEISSTKESLE